MRQFLLSVSALALLSLTACEKEGWTEENTANYMQQCRQEAMGMYRSEAQVMSYCNCNFAAIKKHYANMEEVVINKDSAAIRIELENCSLNAQRGR